jgi:hypothetical protein
MNFTKIIASDFSVKEISTTEEITLFGAAKGVLLHFVLSGSHQISQFYVHRHEMARCLKSGFNTPGSQVYKLSSGLSVEVISNPKGLSVLSGSHTLPVDLKKSALGKLILSDISLLDEIENKLKDKEYAGSVGARITGNNAEQAKSVFDLQEIGLAAFEFAILDKQKKIDRNGGIYSLLKNKASNFIPELSFLMMGDNTVFTSDHCDCGSDGCFFSMLSDTINEQFKGKEFFLTNGNFDDKKAAKIFDAFWSGLSAGQQAALRYLEFEFNNSVFLNISMFNKNFSLQEYLRLMTFPYQPDSEDEAFVRTRATICRYYLSLL